jgi:DNA-binding NarL/FixJ family response regulator
MPRRGNEMVRDITISSRELSPFEKLVLELVCEGKSNAAIAKETAHTEKVIENTVSRSAQVFGIKSDSDTNLRVLLALAQ